jgi:hypothetical protein
VSFREWSLQFNIWTRILPDRVAEALGVLLIIIPYYLLIRWARDKLILSPFRDALRSDLDKLSRQVIAVDPGDNYGLRARIEIVDGELATDEALWTGGNLYRALLLRQETDQWLAGTGTPEQVRGRARIVAHALDDSHDWLREDMLAIASGNEDVTESHRELIRHAVTLTVPDHTEDTATQLALHRKTNWLVLTGLGVILILTAAFGNAAIVAAGILGAFLSRIGAFTRQRATSALAFNWTTLMLSPVVGALAALAGVLLVQVLVVWQVLGSMLNTVGWGRVNTPTLAVAFLLGFSERLLDSLVGVATEKLAAPETSPEPPNDNNGGGGGDHSGGGDDSDRRGNETEASLSEAESSESHPVEAITYEEEPEEPKTDESDNGEQLRADPANDVDLEDDREDRLGPDNLAKVSSDRGLGDGGGEVRDQGKPVEDPSEVAEDTSPDGGDESRRPDPDKNGS